jgi:hypothetical protein
MLTVKELIAQLALLDPDAVVIMQRDPEGNGYAPCSGADGNGSWDKNEGEYGYATLTPELERQGYSEEDIISGVPAVVIWPSY